MAGKKKAAKKVAAKKAPAKKAPAEKPAKRKYTKRATADKSEKMQVAEFEKRVQSEREAFEKDLKENPFAYRVMCFMSEGVYPLDDFKTLEDAQDCVESQAQVNDVKWSIIIEKRPERQGPRFSGFGIRDGW